MHLLVTVAGLAPGAPLAAASALADALDTRRVPLTLLVGPRPHPEVAAWAGARRHAGDAVLLHGTRPGPVGRRPYRRLPAHEAGLRLAGALRAAEACGRDHAGSGVDGFAAPGWACSDGVRRALVAAGLDLLVDDEGVHRLTSDGALSAGALRARPERLRARPGTLRPRPRTLQHVRALVDGTGVRGDVAPGEVEALVDRALAAGVVPATAPTMVPVTPVPARRGGDPERWPITA